VHRVCHCELQGGLGQGCLGHEGTLLYHPVLEHGVGGGGRARAALLFTQYTMWPSSCSTQKTSRANTRITGFFLYWCATPYPILQKTIREPLPSCGHKERCVCGGRGGGGRGRKRTGGRSRTAGLFTPPGRVTGAGAKPTLAGDEGLAPREDVAGSRPARASVAGRAFTTGAVAAAAAAAVLAARAAAAGVTTGPGA
jgi:hypothetical protein